MKIFLISNMYPSSDNPAYGVFVKNMLDGLINEGVTISVKAIISKRPLGIFQYILSYSAYFISGIAGLFKKFDIIYCHYVLHNAPLALLIQVISRKALVVNIHGTDMLGTGHAVRLFGPFRSLLLKRATLIVVPSNFMKQRTMELTKLPEEKFFVSPSGGIQLPKISVSRDAPQTGLIFGYVGRIVKEKGIFVLLEALNKLAKLDSSLKWQLIMAGGGPDETLFLETAKEYGIDNRIIWHGILPQNELANLYKQMTILIFPTLLEESLGLVGLEAMAYGVPVVGSKIGGLQDYIIDNKNGYFYEPNNVKELNNILNKIALDSTLVENIRQHARVTAEKYEGFKVSKEILKKMKSLI